MPELQRSGPLAALACPVCEVSDSADVFWVKDGAGIPVATVFRCCICGALSLMPA